MKVREPVARPLDVVAAELLLSGSQAFLAGVLFYLAIGVWDDRGVGFGPVAVILAMLGAAVGGGWLYWLLGGVGWPLAAANVPTSMFLGFALVLGWQGDDLFRVEGVPLLLSLAASVYGIICGAFLDSPRRWRWDQRQKLRPGTVVPRVSPATRTFVTQVPRSLPARRAATLQRADVLSPSVAGSPAAPSGDVGLPDLSPGASELDMGEGPTAKPDEGVVGEPVEAGPRPVATADAAAPPPTMPTDRLQQAAESDTSEAPASAAEPTTESRGIELPTSVEPKAQRSPWAWAAPPEWSRDEEDEPPRGRSSSRR